VPKGKGSLYISTHTVKPYDHIEVPSVVRGDRATAGNRMKIPS
jgi:hypothetical protein